MGVWLRVKPAAGGAKMHACVLLQVFRAFAGKLIWTLSLSLAYFDASLPDVGGAT